MVCKLKTYITTLFFVRITISLIINPQEFIPSASIIFVSQASIDLGVIDSYGIKKRVEAVKNCRNISKRDMKYNDTMPKMRVDPESYVSLTIRSFFTFMIKYRRREVYFESFLLIIGSKGCRG